MSTMTTLDPVTVAIEDLDSEPACQVRDCYFGHPPATHIVWAPCGCSWFVCNKSAGIAFEKLKIAEVSGRNVLCMRCNSTLDPFAVRIEPRS